MRKEYKKPQILMESLELTQHIAVCGLQSEGKVNNNLQQTCTVQIYFGTKAMCDMTDGQPTSFEDKKWDQGGYTAFATGNKSCERPVEGYCYTEGTGGLKIMAS